MIDIPLAHVSLSIPFGLDDPNIFRACFGHIKSLVSACLFIVSWWSILILPMWYDLVLQICWCITPVKPGLDAQRLLHVHCLHAAVWHPWCGELWPREQDVAYQHWLKCVGKIEMEHVYVCLISIYIYINIHIMRNLQDYVVLWAVDMCQLIFARNHAKAIAGQGLSMSPSWYIISSVITWREYDLTIISPESHVGYLGTKY